MLSPFTQAPDTSVGPHRYRSVRAMLCADTFCESWLRFFSAGRIRPQTRLAAAEAFCVSDNVVGGALSLDHVLSYLDAVLPSRKLQL